MAEVKYGSDAAQIGPGTEKPVGRLRSGVYIGRESHLRSARAVLYDAEGHGPDKLCAQFNNMAVDDRALHAGWWLFDTADWKEV